MTSRLNILKVAKALIYEKIIEALPIKIVGSNLQTIYIGLWNDNVLIIGKNKRYLIRNIDVQKLEDMLNILMQFDFIRSYERVCGDVFKVTLYIKTTNEAVIIEFKNYSNKAA